MSKTLCRSGFCRRFRSSNFPAVNISVFVAVGGKPMRVNARTVSSTTLFSCDQMLKMQTHVGMSQNDLTKVANDLRTFSQNRRVVEPGLKPVCAMRNQTFDDLFDIVEFNGMTSIFCNVCTELVPQE
jgi:hypothetical protein